MYKVYISVIPFVLQREFQPKLQMQVFVRLHHFLNCAFATFDLRAGIGRSPKPHRSKRRLSIGQDSTETSAGPRAQEADGKGCYENDQERQLIKRPAREKAVAIYKKIPLDWIDLVHGRLNYVHECLVDLHNHRTWCTQIKSDWS